MQAARRARWAVAAMFAANGLAMGAWAPQIPPLMPRHQIGEAVLGLVILCLGLGAVAAMLVSGRLIARFGGRLVLRGFAFALIPTLPLIVLAPSLPLLVLAALLFGAIAGSLDVAMNAAAVQVERRLGRAIMSVSHGFWSLGGFIGAGAGGWIMAQWGAMAQALIVAGVIAVLVGVAARFLLQDEVAMAQAEGPKGFLPRDPGLWLIGLLALFCMVPEGAVMDWAAVYLGQELGADTFRAGLGFAVFAGAMAVMRFSGDMVRNRLGAVKTLRISGLAGAAGLLIAALAPTELVALAGFALAGLGVANLAPVMYSAAGNHPGLPSGVAISAVTTVGYAGILVAPAVIGFIAEHIGFRITYAALAGLLLLVVAQAGRARNADAARSVR
ncbi:MAG: MFS transporter [Pseudorhodobacter sp.]|nr:MAG: MFS transporter [Pseudorhodobacter sp.]